jgi:hypothetical protein
MAEFCSKILTEHATQCIYVSYRKSIGNRVVALHNTRKILINANEDG